MSDKKKNPKTMRDEISIFGWGPRPRTKSLNENDSECQQFSKISGDLEKYTSQFQSLATLGMLTSNVAHDFNNILMAILGNTESVHMDLPPESPLGSRIDAIKDLVSNGVDLTKQILDYAKNDKSTTVSLDLNSLIKNTSQLLRLSITDKANVEYKLSDDLPCVNANSTAIQQIITNLVINSSEALGCKHGTISIRTGVTYVDSEYLASVSLEHELKIGSYVYFEVSDTGCGIDDVTLDRVFVPFFTTKSTGHGLGLASAIGIMHEHNGAITVSSTPDKGTVFRVLFPFAEDLIPSGRPSESSLDEMFMGKKLLIADDEKAVLQIVAEMIQGLGVEVVTAEDGREALRRFKTKPSCFDCVILDFDMPHMNGYETYLEMRRIRENVSVILSSGYSTEDLEERFVNEDFSGFLQKPFQTNSLRDSLFNAMRGNSE